MRPPGNASARTGRRLTPYACRSAAGRDPAMRSGSGQGRIRVTRGGQVRVEVGRAAAVAQDRSARGRPGSGGPEWVRTGRRRSTAARPGSCQYRAASRPHSAPLTVLAIRWLTSWTPFLTGCCSASTRKPLASKNARAVRLTSAVSPTAPRELASSVRRWSRAVAMPRRPCPGATKSMSMWPVPMRPPKPTTLPSCVESSMTATTVSAERLARSHSPRSLANDGSGTIRAPGPPSSTCPGLTPALTPALAPPTPVPPLSRSPAGGTRVAPPTQAATCSGV